MTVRLEGVQIQGLRTGDRDARLGLSMRQGIIEDLIVDRSSEGWRIEFGERGGGIQSNHLIVGVPFLGLSGNLMIAEAHIPHGSLNIDPSSILSVFIPRIDLSGHVVLNHSNGTQVLNMEGSSTVEDIRFRREAQEGGTLYRLVNLNYEGEITQAHLADPYRWLGRFNLGTTAPSTLSRNERDNSIPPISGRFQADVFFPCNSDRSENLHYTIVVNAPTLQISQLQPGPLEPIPWENFRVSPTVTQATLSNVHFERTEQGWVLTPFQQEAGPTQVALHLANTLAIYDPAFTRAELSQDPLLHDIGRTILRVDSADVRGNLERVRYQYVQRERRGKVETLGQFSEVLATGLRVYNIQGHDTVIWADTALFDDTGPLAGLFWGWMYADIPRFGGPPSNQSRPRGIPSPDFSSWIHFLSPEEQDQLATGDLLRMDRIRTQTLPHGQYTQLCGVISYIHEIGGHWQFGLFGLPEVNIFQNGNQGPNQNREPPFRLNRNSFLHAYLRNPSRGWIAPHTQGRYRTSPHCPPTPLTYPSLPSSHR